MDRLWFLVFLGGFVIPGVRHVWGIEVFTTSEVEAVNGTSVTLKCTFSSTRPVSLRTVTVKWEFRSITSKSTERIFYYQEVPYPILTGLFNGQVKWSGDLMRKDASITLNDVRPTFNGTYTCTVANPPDVFGNTGETILSVVNKVPLSEISLLAAIAGGSCAIILVFLGIFIGVKVYRNRNTEKDIEMRVEEYSKDPTVCSPAEAVNLTALKTKKEAVSSDNEESQPSSGDDEEEEGPGNKDEDDDDDDLGGDDDDDN